MDCLLTSYVARIAMTGEIAPLTIATTISLIAFLVMREMSVLSKSSRGILFGRYLVVAIVPLLFVFLLAGIEAVF